MSRSKGMEVDEVYNVLCGCLIKAIQKYDPDYVLKMKDVIDAIEEMPEDKKFTVDEGKQSCWVADFADLQGPDM